MSEYCICGNRAERLCDYPVLGEDGYRRVGHTCDAGLCLKCTNQVSEFILCPSDEVATIDFCDIHLRMSRLEVS